MILISGPSPAGQPTVLISPSRLKVRLPYLCPFGRRADLLGWPCREPGVCWVQPSGTDTVTPVVTSPLFGHERINRPRNPTYCVSLLRSSQSFSCQLVHSSEKNLLFQCHHLQTRAMTSRRLVQMVVYICTHSIHSCMHSTLSNPVSHIGNGIQCYFLPCFGKDNCTSDVSSGIPYNVSGLVGCLKTNLTV